MKTFNQFHSEFPVIPEPIHYYKNSIITEELQSPNDIFDLDKELKQSHIITNPEHIKEIKKYTNGSFHLNNQLLDLYKNKLQVPNKIIGTNFDWFNSKGNDKPPYEGYKRYSVEHNIIHLDNLTNHKVKRNLNVYSGIRFNPNDILDSRKILHIPSYYSSTIDPKITKEFSEGHDGINRVIHLHLNPDDKGIYIDKHHTFQNGEYKELLLPRNTSLKIHHEELDHIDGQPTRIFHATIHHQE